MNDRSPDALPSHFRASGAGRESGQRPTPPPDDDTLDQGIAESFPASDPVSVTVSEPPSAAPRAPNAAPAADARPLWQRPAPVALASSAVIGLGAVAWWAYGAWQRSHSSRRRLARFGLR